MQKKNIADESERDLAELVEEDEQRGNLNNQIFETQRVVPVCVRSEKKQLTNKSFGPWFETLE